MSECVFCHESQIVKNGKTPCGEQFFHCKACKSFFTGSTNPKYPNHSFDADTLKLSVFWYFRYQLSYRKVAEMMAIRGIELSHQSVFRWVAKLGPEFGKKARNLHRSKRTVSWYVDETYVKVKGKWTYLYRAVDRN